MTDTNGTGRNLDRRAFMRGSAALGLYALASRAVSAGEEGPADSAAQRPDTSAAGEEQAYEQVRVALSELKGLDGRDRTAGIKVGDKEIILIKLDDNTIRALDATCTHKQCPVRYKPKWGHLRCRCHGSRFALDGTVLNPPAKKSLASYKAETENDQLVIFFPK